MQYGTQVGEGWAIREAPLRWVKTVIKKMPLTVVYQRETTADEWVRIDPATLPVATRTPAPVPVEPPAPMTMRLKLSIGDYFKESHRLVEVFDLIASSNYTKKELAFNYIANINAFDMKPDDVFLNSEGFVFADGAIDFLNAHGLAVEVPTVDLNTLGADYSATAPIYLNDVSQYFKGEERYEMSDEFADMVKIVMMFVSYGLEGFRWEFLKEDHIDLNELLGKQSFGLGFYSND